MKDSIHTPNHSERVCSRTRVVLPKARRAAYWASSPDSPRSRCSSSSSSRSDSSSRSRSASRLSICHQRISTLLGRGPHDARHGFRHLLPLRFFDDKLLPALFGEPVILELPLAVRGSLPFRGDPSLPFQTVQRGIQRTVLHLEEVIGAALNVLTDLVSVCRAPGEGAQDKHVKRAQKKVHALFGFWHSRRSTLNKHNSRTSTIDCQGKLFGKSFDPFLSWRLQGNGRFHQTFRSWNAHRRFTKNLLESVRHNRLFIPRQPTVDCLSYGFEIASPRNPRPSAAEGALA